MGEQDGFTQLCVGPKAGSVSATDWVAEIKRIYARGPASTLETKKPQPNIFRGNQFDELSEQRNN